MTVPLTGITVDPHIALSMDDAEQRLQTVFLRLRTLITTRAKTRARATKLPKRECEALWRQLAGVTGDVETIRIWLARGAPRA